MIGTIATSMITMLASAHIGRNISRAFRKRRNARMAENNGEIKPLTKPDGIRELVTDAAMTATELDKVKSDEEVELSNKINSVSKAAGVAQGTVSVLTGSNPVNSALQGAAMYGITKVGGELAAQSVLGCKDFMSWAKKKTLEILANEMTDEELEIINSKGEES